MKIYALLVAQLLLSPSAAIADHERAWDPVRKHASLL
jgi:hypothetical protein